MKNILIIGAGMAGFRAAHHFYKNNLKATIYEKNNYIGGHAASFQKDGFIFDDGPHISFTKNERIRKLFHKSVNGAVEYSKAYVNNYWKGFWIKHPAQINLNGLPNKLMTNIISEFFEVSRINTNSSANYKEYLLETYGKTFSETFPLEYTKKYHTTEAENLDIDWIGSRLYKPDLEEVIKGALSAKTEDKHYVTEFFYPVTGGFVRFFDQFINNADLKYSHEVVKIDPVRKLIYFNNGRTRNYDYLISSVPLPELIPRIEGVPGNVLEACQKLACTSCVMVNLGVSRRDISKAHWTYFYDKEILFSRLSFPHLMSPGNVPENCGSIQAEIYFSKKYKPLAKEPDDYIEPTIMNLKQCGILKDNDEIIFKEARLSPYANIIFDLDRIPNLSVVHEYLKRIDIKYCGRYAEWGYHWTDESFLSGEKAAIQVIEQLKAGKINGKSSQSVARIKSV